MMKKFANFGLLLAIELCLIGCSAVSPGMNRKFRDYTLDYATPVDSVLQAQFDRIDADLRARYGMTTEQAAAGVLDLKALRLAMIHPDRGEYAASVPKIGILLAYFQLHPQAATNLGGQTRHQLGLMVKVSDNEMASKFSQEMGLRQIQEILNSYHFYDEDHGGGIWIGLTSPFTVVRKEHDDADDFQKGAKTGAN